MESQSFNKPLLSAILSQIQTAIDQLFEWNTAIQSSDDYATSPDGMKTLAASSMLLEAIGEGLKKVDKCSNKQLFPLRPEIPWKDVMGMRDHIAHGYFDIDAELIFDAVKNDLPSLSKAIEYFLEYLK
jgi:uncharacterized protein with HEPN domain